MDATALMNMAHEQRKAGDLRLAIDRYQQVLELAGDSGNVDVAWVARTFLALSYKQLGELRKSLQLHEENLAFARQHPHELVVGPMNREADSLQSLASDYFSLGDPAKSAELLGQVLVIEEQKGPDRFGLRRAKVTQKLGIVQFLSGNLAQAEKTLSESQAEFEAARKARMGFGMAAAGEYEFEVELIRWLQKVAVAQGRTDEALELAEKGRSRALAGLLASRLGAGSEPPPETALTKPRMREIAAAQRSTLVEYSVLYQYDPDLPLEFSDYRAIPATDILIWVIKPTGEIAFRQTTLDPPLGLTELVRAAREAIGARGRGRGAGDLRRTDPGGRAPEVPELRRLHQLLVEPIADLLPADPDALITFLPQDLLFLVPFAALQDDTGKFVIERQTVAAAPSIEVLALTHERQQQVAKAGKGALIVGNPTMPTLRGNRLPDLPGAEDEAKAVATLLDAPVLLGQGATKKATVSRMPQARIIHLATHGLLDDVGGEFSSLALAPADGDEGFLTARELLALELNAELVVLSACDTGLGKITGDGVAGLSRALIGAGASSVLVSLWSVPDAPTMSLMRTFYEGLERGADKAQALRQAMLTTMNQYPNPIDWAAFTLIGDAAVSKALRAAIKSGMGGDDGIGLPAPVSATRYELFPVPEGIEHYVESVSGENGEQVGIGFDTVLSHDELMAFYRRAFTKDGLREDSNLADQNKEGFSLVFRGSPNGKVVVVQGTDMSSLGTDRRAVSVRWE